MSNRNITQQCKVKVVYLKFLRWGFSNRTLSIYAYCNRNRYKYWIFIANAVIVIQQWLEHSYMTGLAGMGNFDYLFGYHSTNDQLKGNDNNINTSQLYKLSSFHSGLYGRANKQTSLEFDYTFGDVLLHKLVQAYQFNILRHTLYII